MHLSEQEEAVVKSLNRVLAAPAVDDQYDQLEGTLDGRLLNADLARELSRDYRNKYDRLAFTRCTYACCSEYVLNRFLRAIRQSGVPGERSALFLAGGAASGKTTSVGSEVLQQYDIVFDSNLAGYEKASGMISQCLESGWFVDINFIFRPYELAVGSMIDRALETGRYIPLGPPSKLAKLHLQAQRTAVRLHNEFSDDYVGISVFENLWIPQNPAKAAEIRIEELDKGGRYYYKSVEELHAIEAEVISAYRQRILTEEAVFQALGEIED